MYMVYISKFFLLLISTPYVQPYPILCSKYTGERNLLEEHRAVLGRYFSYQVLQVIFVAIRHGICGADILVIKTYMFYRHQHSDKHRAVR